MASPPTCLYRSSLVQLLLGVCVCAHVHVRTCLRMCAHALVRGVCNFLGSVSLQQKFEATEGPVLQLSFIWQAKENTPLRREGGPTQNT